MAAAALVGSIPELDGAIKGGSPERCTQVLRQVTSLFVSAADRLDETQVGVFDDIIGLLIARVDARTLAHLGDALSEMDMAPRATIRQLAFHDDASVAAPVLTKSNRLSEKDLVEIINTRGQQHLLAISGRKVLNETLTDALIGRGDVEVSNALAQNAGAHFSESGYTKLVGHAERDESLTETLGLRWDIPAKLLRELLAKATDAVRARFLTAPRPVIAHKAQASIAAKTSAAPAAPIDYRQAQHDVDMLNRSAKLNDSVVNRFAVRSEYSYVVAALSFMSEVKIEAIEPLMNGDRLYGLIVACRAARLSWSTTMMIIRNRPTCAPATEREFEQGLAVFEGLPLSVAQWTIRFGSDRMAKLIDGAQRHPAVSPGARHATT